MATTTITQLYPIQQSAMESYDGLESYANVYHTDLNGTTLFTLGSFPSSYTTSSGSTATTLAIAQRAITPGDKVNAVFYARLNDMGWWDWQASSNTSMRLPGLQIDAATWTFTRMHTVSNGSVSGGVISNISYSGGTLVTVTLSPDGTVTRDGSIHSSLATTNSGSGVLMQTGTYIAASTASRVLLAFDFSSIPSNARILGGSVELAPSSSKTVNSTALNLYRVLRTWDESTFTWTKYDATGSWAAPGARGSGDTSPTESAVITTTTVTGGLHKVWSDAKLTADIQGFVDGTLPNNGWLLTSNRELITLTAANSIEWCSSDHSTEARRPKATIQYMLPDSGSASIVCPMFGSGIINAPIVVGSF